jgi:hypothetical protein
MILKPGGRKTVFGGNLIRHFDGGHAESGEGIQPLEGLLLWFFIYMFS